MTSLTESADLSACNREPIRTPGTVQSEGVLLVFGPVLHRADDVLWRPDYDKANSYAPPSQTRVEKESNCSLHFEIVAVSDNSLDFLKDSPGSLLRAPLSRLFSPLVSLALHKHFCRGAIDGLGLDAPSGMLQCGIKNVDAYVSDAAFPESERLVPSADRLLAAATEASIDLHDGVRRPTFVLLPTVMQCGVEVELFAHSWRGFHFVELFAVRPLARPHLSLATSKGASVMHSLRLSANAEIVSSRRLFDPCVESTDVERLERSKSSQENDLTRRLAELQIALDVSHNAQQCAHHIAKYCSEISGFDRVLVYRFAHRHACVLFADASLMVALSYRFDATDGHGEVIGEVISASKTTSWTPYMGLRYPATDIPIVVRTNAPIKIAYGSMCISDVSFDLFVKLCLG